ncbi:uncharacterized protein Ecym_5328 [Eremothecium cymbalariae DBVPG|uniref:ZZ-type domain-containing protein n=1 Tax=Eremothecium cymbalariae (strain CBS 270.75 / DBVPG 7215 / KCTC 17166 / NRRL Y-17582) TaxID=931890 RepID=I6NDE5_ERECY|nr:hypothetical protein Ecym_5328 [Eremothecium cymbalariae DBVPG\
METFEESESCIQGEAEKYNLHLIYNYCKKSYYVHPEEMCESLIKSLIQNAFWLDHTVSCEDVNVSLRDGADRSLVAVEITEAGVEKLREQLRDFGSAELVLVAKDSSEIFAALNIKPHAGENNDKRALVGEETDSKMVTILKDQWEQLVASINDLSSLLHKQPSEEDSSVVHNGIVCDGCSLTNDGGKGGSKTCSKDGFIRGPRYKCLGCENFDLCSECEFKGVSIACHSISHTLVKIKRPGDLWQTPSGDLVHNHIICDGCNPYRVTTRNTDTSTVDGYIKGPRFKCTKCFNYDLCIKCKENNVSTWFHKQSHPMVEVKAHPESPTLSNNDLVHNGIYCNSCQNFMNPSKWNTKTCSSKGFIKGPRYKCLTCQNFDLCSVCHEKGISIENHRESHNMVCFGVPDTSNLYHPPSRSPSPSNRFPAGVHKNNTTGNKNLTIEIPPEQSDVYEVLLKMQNEGTLASVVHEAEDYQRIIKRFDTSASEIFERLGRYEELLLMLPDGNYDKLKSLIEEHLKCNNKAPISPADSAMKSPSSSEILVEVCDIDYVVTFKLTNHTDEVLPDNMKLLLNYFPDDGEALKYCIFMGPHKIAPDESKLLNLNHHGSIKRLFAEGKYQLDLLDQNDILLYTTKLTNEAKVSMKPLTRETVDGCLLDFEVVDGLVNSMEKLSASSKFSADTLARDEGHGTDTNCDEKGNSIFKDDEDDDEDDDDDDDSNSTFNKYFLPSINDEEYDLLSDSDIEVV